MTRVPGTVGLAGTAAPGDGTNAINASYVRAAAVQSWLDGMRNARSDLEHDNAVWICVHQRSSHVENVVLCRKVVPYRGYTQEFLSYILHTGVKEKKKVTGLITFLKGNPGAVISFVHLVSLPCDGGQCHQ